MTEKLVYLIHEYESGMTKIGSSADPEKRLAQLQIGSPHELFLLIALPGGREVELRLHDELDFARRHGEWFWIAENLPKVILRVWKYYNWIVYGEGFTDPEYGITRPSEPHLRLLPGNPRGAG